MTGRAEPHCTCDDMERASASHAHDCQLAEEPFPCAVCGTDIDPHQDAYCIKAGVGPMCVECIDEELGRANDDFEP